jgi:hypothetical protein
MQEACPFEFNFDPTTFKVGDTVSYRVPQLGDFPFMANITAVFDDHIEIVNPAEPDKVLKASRVSRPIVSDEAAFS